MFNEAKKMPKNTKWDCFNSNGNSFFIIYSLFKFNSQRNYSCCNISCSR